MVFFNELLSEEELVDGKWFTSVLETSPNAAPLKKASERALVSYEQFGLNVPDHLTGTTQHSEDAHEVSGFMWGDADDSTSFGQRTVTAGYGRGPSANRRKVRNRVAPL